VVLDTAGLNATELGGYCRERGLFPDQVDRWRQAAQDANAQPLLTMAEQKDFEKRHQQDQREIKRLQQELRRKEKALAEAAALLIASKRSRPTGERTRGIDLARGSAQGAGDPRCRRGGRCTGRQAPSCWASVCPLCSAGGVSSRLMGTAWIAVKAATALFLTVSRTWSASGSCSPATSWNSPPATGADRAHPGGPGSLYRFGAQLL
jgi:hypothetical protein